jgi:outer membrane protein assembly factor BamB
VAFNASDGRIVWRGGSFDNVNSSPILADVDGEMQVIALGAAEVVGLDARTGAARWRHPHPHRFRENIPTPIWSDGLLFVTSYADGGSRMLALDREDGLTRVREQWHHRRLRVYYTNVARIGDMLYGSSGDSGPTVFTAADVNTGEVLWQTRDITRSNMVAVGRTLILRDDLGQLVIATPGADGLLIHSTTAVLAAGPPTPPTLRGGWIYLRDRREILALRP